MQSTKHALRPLRPDEGPRQARRSSGLGALSPRTKTSRSCTCSDRPGSLRCVKHGYLVPSSERLRRLQANKEIVRRALSPPIRRLSLRWLNFRPSPSRLCNMSTSDICG